MKSSTKQEIEGYFLKLESILRNIKDEQDNHDEDEAINYVRWMFEKAELRYLEENKKHQFPLIYMRIYWAHMGINVGREEDKHRPVVIVRKEKKSPICHVVPLTTKRLEDGYWYHIDLEGLNNTALVEHFRTISCDRIDKPLWIEGQIAKVSDKNMNQIHNEIKRLFGGQSKDRKK